MDIESLNRLISSIEEKTKSKEWKDGLDSRKKEEADFHDYSHDMTTELENKKFYKTTQLSSDYLEKWLKDNVKDKIFLDYACGNGVTANKAAIFGAAFTIGIDISPGSISNAQNLAKKYSHDKITRFFVGDCENTGLPDNSIDVILCAGMLHHLDLNYAYPEMHRILKTGGKIIALEALAYNPIIKAYRMLTPEMRTEWEKHHILSMRDVKLASKFFKISNVKFWHITSFAAAFLGSPKWILSFLDSVDSVLTKIPLIKLLSWQFTFELEKEK